MKLTYIFIFGVLLISAFYCENVYSIAPNNVLNTLRLSDFSGRYTSLNGTISSFGNFTVFGKYDLFPVTNANFTRINQTLDILASMNGNNSFSSTQLNISGIVKPLQPIKIYSLRGPNYTAGPKDLIASNVDTPIKINGLNVDLLEIYKTGNFVISGNVTLTFKNATAATTTSIKNVNSENMLNKAFAQGSDTVDVENPSMGDGEPGCSHCR